MYPKPIDVKTHHELPDFIQAVEYLLHPGMVLSLA
jgi:aconitase B